MSASAFGDPQYNPGGPCWIRTSDPGLLVPRANGQDILMPATSGGIPALVHKLFWDPSSPKNTPQSWSSTVLISPVWPPTSKALSDDLDSILYRLAMRAACIVAET
jgi:hypothetical protein